MKILQIHNKYLLKGGEDSVLDNERLLLQQKGHEVFLYERDNKEIDEMLPYKKASLFWKTTWSKKTIKEVTAKINQIQPDICHIHNTFPLITPSVYSACKAQNVPVVQTLHNYRLLCTNAYLFRKNAICEKCIVNSKIHSFINKCYHDSFVMNLSVILMLKYNEWNGTWQNNIARYICLTEYSKEIFTRAGLPPKKIMIKPNFLCSDPGISNNKGEYFLFIGRFEESKGIKVLLEAMKYLTKVKIKIAGSGIYSKNIKEIVGDNISYLGVLKSKEVMDYIKGSIAVIFPSIWYEVMPMSIIESFSCGKAVIASRLGAMKEMIDDGKTGLLFEPGNSLDLAEKLKWANKNIDKMYAMGINARKTFELKYSSEVNYKRLIEIYESALKNNADNK